MKNQDQWKKDNESDNIMQMKRGYDISNIYMLKHDDNNWTINKGNNIHKKKSQIKLLKSSNHTADDEKNVIEYVFIDDKYNNNVFQRKYKINLILPDILNEITYQEKLNIYEWKFNLRADKDLCLKGSVEPN